MELQTLIGLAVKLSIMLIVLGLGLNASLHDATYLFRRPGELVRSLLAMNVLMPIFALALAALFDLHPAVKVALLALALSPVPPFLPKKAVKTVGTTSYSIGLLVTTAVFSIIFVPVVLALFEQIFSMPMQMTIASVALLVASSVLVPLVIGIGIHALAPSLAEKCAKPVSTIGMILLVVGCLPILIASFSSIVSLIGNGTLLALAAFVIVAVLVGHFLGGPDPDDRTMLALATASRHPAIAMAIAHNNFPQQKFAAPAVLLYLILSGIVSAPYVAWTKKKNSSAAGTAKA
jgi:BASS family bile acid:Na+ symporter